VQRARAKKKCRPLAHLYSGASSIKNHRFGIYYRQKHNKLEIYSK